MTAALVFISTSAALAALAAIGTGRRASQPDTVEIVADTLDTHEPDAMALIRARSAARRQLATAVRHHRLAGGLSTSTPTLAHVLDPDRPRPSPEQTYLSREVNR